MVSIGLQYWHRAALPQPGRVVHSGPPQTRGGPSGSLPHIQCGTVFRLVQDRSRLVHHLFLGLTAPVCWDGLSAAPLEPAVSSSNIAYELLPYGRARLTIGQTTYKARPLLGPLGLRCTCLSPWGCPALPGPPSYLRLVATFLRAALTCFLESFDLTEALAASIAA